ncbi:hypothetical protein ACFL2V_11315 [Pseudomonadota bacterium]
MEKDLNAKTDQVAELFTHGRTGFPEDAEELDIVVEEEWDLIPRETMLTLIKEGKTPSDIAKFYLETHMANLSPAAKDKFLEGLLKTRGEVDIVDLQSAVNAELHDVLNPTSDEEDKDPVAEDIEWERRRTGYDDDTMASE